MSRIKAFLRFIRRGPFYSFLAEVKVNNHLHLPEDAGNDAYIQLPLEE